MDVFPRFARFMSGWLVAVLVSILGAVLPAALIAHADGPAALVKDIRPGSRGSTISDSIDLNGTLFFAANDGVHGLELWKSDGTTNGTVLVKDIHQGSEDEFETETNLGGFFTWNRELFFTANDGTHGHELWKSDGTANGTVLVKDIYRRAGYNAYPGDFVIFKGKLFFGATDDTHGRELWTSDGTTNGTTLVKDTFQDSATTNSTTTGRVQDLFVEGNTLFFLSQITTDEPNNISAYVVNLWRSDGTATGTTKIEQVGGGWLNFGVGSYTTPEHFTDLNGTLFFTLHTAFYDSGAPSGQSTQLYHYDPTSNQIVNIPLESGVRTITGLTVFHGKLLFALSSTDRVELWTSDGTTTGTVRVTDFNGTLWHETAVVNGKLVFIAADATHGKELWISDGTAAGTTLVKDINPDQHDTYGPTDLTPVGNLLFFVADDGVHGRELWRSDGTAAGTLLVQDINPGSANASPACLTLSGNKLFFAAYDGTHGSELWVVNQPDMALPTETASPSPNPSATPSLTATAPSDATATSTAPADASPTLTTLTTLSMATATTGPSTTQQHTLLLPSIAR